MVEAFYPGQLGGDGIISALTGAANKFGRMPYTTYFKNFTARDVRDVDLAHGSGVTYRHFAGPVRLGRVAHVAGVLRVVHKDQ